MPIHSWGDPCDALQDTCCSEFQNSERMTVNLETDPPPGGRYLTPRELLSYPLIMPVSPLHRHHPHHPHAANVSAEHSEQVS